MGDQREDSKRDSKEPRQAVIPPEPRVRYASRVPTLPPPAEPRPPSPEPKAASIDRSAGRKPAPSAIPKPRRVTRLSEFLEMMEKAREGRQPRFDKDAHESMERARASVPGGKKEPMDWSDVKVVTKVDCLPSLEQTLIQSFPPPQPGEVPAGMPKVDGLLSKRLWLEAGLPRVRKKKAVGREEPPDIKKALDHWFLSLNHAAKEVLLSSLIEDTVSEFSALKHASEEGSGGLLTVCSGGRPLYTVEASVATPVATISEQFLRKLNTMKANGLLSDLDAKALVEQLVRFVFHAPRPVEGPGITETEMRNGFFRAVAWCICTRTNPALFQEFFSRNHILLIDAVGIAAGLNSNEAKKLMGEEGVRSAIYRLMKKRWVAVGFEHLKEMLRADSRMGRLDPRAVFHFTTVLLKEVSEYQRIVQSYSILSRNMSNLSRAFSSDVLYLGEKEFMECLLSRGNLQPALREGIDKMHEFVARLFSKRTKGSLDHEGYQYAVGRSPAEISDIFNTVLEGLDFLLGDPKMRRIALEAIQHYGIAGGEGQPASFKKLFALRLFERSTEVQDYGKLYSMLFDYSNPIISDIALDYCAFLLAKGVNFMLLHDEKQQEYRPTLSEEDLAQIRAEGDSPL